MEPELLKTEHRLNPTPSPDHNRVMNNPDRNCHRFYYRVVIIRIDGKRDVQVRNLYRTNAKLVAQSIMHSGKTAVLERQNGVELD
jgi:hypothetical protein